MTAYLPATTRQHKGLARLILFLIIMGSTLVPAMVFGQKPCPARFSIKYVDNQTIEVHDSTQVGYDYGYVFNTGDGDTTMRHHFTHRYDSTGVYIVCMQFRDSLGNLCTVCSQPFLIYVRGCLGWFTFKQTSDLTVDFKDSSIAEHGFKVKWAFGDGDSSFVSNPQHKYDSAGIYLVNMVLTDTVSGCTEIRGRYVSVTGSSSGIRSAAVAGNTLRAYPNPAHTTLTLDALPATGGTLSIYDINGRVLKQSLVVKGTTSLQLNISDLPNGLYVARIISKTAGEAGIVRFVKE